MAYSYGLRESEMDNASLEFIGLFLAGHIARENERVKSGWEQARFIASAMSKEAAKIKFAWERSKGRGYALDIPNEVWDKFTPDFTGKKVGAEELKKIMN